MSGNMTYAGSGVDYEALDPFKCRAQLVARETSHNIRRLADGEFQVVEASRGESAFLIEAAHSYFAHVEEGLGTKNLVADEMYRLTGRSFYEKIAQDTVAMIVNDMITVGASPLSVAMHLAVGDSAWFDDTQRYWDLIAGWKKACGLSRCAWGPGETPTLRDVVMPGAVVLSGSALGIVKPKERLIDPKNIQAGDSIVIIESSGIHSNGLTLARKIAEQQPEGYLTPLSGGRSFGRALLDPTHIYVGLVEDCLSLGVHIHYAVNITGHGWRKLMRAPQPFAYVVRLLPSKLPIFSFLQEQGPVDDREAYGNLNMGAGFALYVPAEEVNLVMSVARGLDLHAYPAGYIEPSDVKKVVISPLGLEYLGETLRVR